MNLNEAVVGDQGVKNFKVSKTDENAFNDFKKLYKGQIDNKCLDEYGYITDNDIWEDTAKEMFLLNKHYIKESKSKFSTIENIFDEFIKEAKENSKNGKYEFKMSDTGLEKEDTPRFKELLMSSEEVTNIEYDPKSNLYAISFNNKETNVEDNKIVESKVEEGNNLSRLYQHTKDKDTFAIIGSQDQNTKQNRSNELKSEIGKAQRQFNNIGYNKLEGTYTYEDGEQGIEDSYIIYNIPKNKALEIADKLNQESIIWKDDNYFGFLKANGEEDGQFKNSKSNMTFDEKITDMFGSMFKNGSNKMAFAFECKLIEATSTGSNFSKQDKCSIVEFPVCKIDLHK